MCGLGGLDVVKLDAAVGSSRSEKMPIRVEGDGCKFCKQSQYTFLAILLSMDIPESA